MKNKNLKTKMVNQLGVKDMTSDNWNRFHLCTKFLLIISMGFGLFPLYGITKNNINNLEFKWKSKMVFYSIFLMSSGLTISLGCIPWILKKISMQNISEFDILEIKKKFKFIHQLLFVTNINF